MQAAGLLADLQVFKLLYYIPVYAALRQFAGLYNEHYLQTGVSDNLERSFKGRKKEETSKKVWSWRFLLYPSLLQFPLFRALKTKHSCFLPFCASV